MVGTHLGPVAAASKVCALEDVLRSETFARSERLKSLLRFLCQAEIDGREGELNEYSIGTAALGRPKDFAPLEDSSVRSRAFELRQRLEKYYAQEAPRAPVRIELRKGSYIPRFCPVQVEEKAAPNAAVPAAVGTTNPDLIDTPAPVSPGAPKSPYKREISIAAVAFAAGAAVMFATLAFWSAAAKPGARVPATRLQTGIVHSPWTPDLETLWRPFLDNDAPLLVAFETRFFVQMGPLVVRDWRVNTLGAVESSEPLMRVQRLFGVHQLYGSGNYTDVGAPGALFFLTRLLSNRIPLSVKSSHEMTAADLRDSNLILLGKPWLDPQIERALAAADLVDDNGKILNSHPAAGEQAVYEDRQDFTDPDSVSEKYSVITMMPNPAGGKRILALTASGSEHPSALAFYLTNPDSVRVLLTHLRAMPGGIPDYYQILVKAGFKGKALVRVGYVASRPFKLR